MHCSCVIISDIHSNIHYALKKHKRGNTQFKYRYLNTILTYSTRPLTASKSSCETRKSKWNCATPMSPVAMFKVSHAYVHAGKRACTHWYTPAYFHTRMHSCRLPLCLAPVLHPPPSLLLSSAAEGVLQETTPTAHCSDLACTSELFPAAACTASGCNPRARRKKARGSRLPSTPVSGSCPQWLRKRPPEEFKSMEKKKQPGHEPPRFV